MSLIPVLFVVAITAATIGLGIWATRMSRTASDFFVAGRSVNVFWNASAISGEYLSAASFMGIAGMPLSGRPLRTTCPIKSPLTSCATSDERTRSGPRAPVASAPWQNPQDCAKRLRPLSIVAV